jgi:hypothetical protein
MRRLRPPHFFKVESDEDNNEVEEKRFQPDAEHVEAPRKTDFKLHQTESKAGLNLAAIP